MFCGKSSRLHTIAKERGDTFRLYDDGPERHEISDAGASLRVDRNRPKDRMRLLKGSTLGRVLDHSALYAAYPELKSLPIKAEKAPEGVNAAFSPLHGIYVNERLLRSDEGIGKLSVAVLHETQHAIQTIEGDNNGAAPAALESLVMREVMRPQLDTVSRMLAADPDIKASEIDFPAVRAFVSLVSNPRIALKDPEVLDRMHSIGFDDAELQEMGQSCEAFFKLRGLTFAQKGFEESRSDHAMRILAAYQATPGELEAHLTGRRWFAPQQPAQTPKVLIAPQEISLKDRLIVAFAKVAFRIRMRLERLKLDIGLGVAQGQAKPSEIALMRPDAQFLGGSAFDDRPVELQHKLTLIDTNIPGQKFVSDEILSAIRQLRSMSPDERVVLRHEASRSADGRGSQDPSIHGANRAHNNQTQRSRPSSAADMSI